VNRGDVYDAELPIGTHPAVVVTRDRAIPILRNVCIAVITSTIRSAPTEVPVGPLEGLDRESVINCDDLVTIPKTVLVRRRGSLGPEATYRLDDALRIALGLD
jgi:mRNA interferase MazF